MNDGIVIPDRMRPVLGIRQFTITNEGEIISPNRDGYVWQTNDWHVAECSPGHTFVRLRAPHKSPVSNCSCGIQVGYDFDSLWDEGTVRSNQGVFYGCVFSGHYNRYYDLAAQDRAWRMVYGLVACGGSVIYHENLMRVEKARIVAFVTVPVTSHKDVVLSEFELERFSHGLAGYEDLRGKSADVMFQLADKYNCDYVSRMEVIRNG